MKKSKIIIISIISFIVIVIGLGIYMLFTPLKSYSDKVTFTVNNGDNKLTIVSNLKSAGLIKSKLYTLAYVFFAPDMNLQAGTYIISTDKSAIDVLNQIKSGQTGQRAETVKITFVEGKKITDYAKTIAKTFDTITEEDFLKAVNNKEFIKDMIDKYWFLDDSILDEEVYYPLEGFLFPTTYEFYKDSTSEDIISKMLSTMENRLSTYKDKIEESKYSAKEILTMASIIEMEGVSKEDRDLVSSVIYNRLNIPMTLGMDSTSYYGSKVEINESASKVDFKAENGYNTYVKAGLPVGPICNPSIESIDSAVNPAKSNYLYFYAINLKDYFFETSTEFYKFIAEHK